MAFELELEIADALDTEVENAGALGSEVAGALVSELEIGALLLGLRCADYATGADPGKTATFRKC